MVSLGERLARSRDAFAREGLRFAWHNHDFEFEPLLDGAFPIEHVLGADLAWEADLAWVTLAGADPLSWIERYRGRIPLVHVKDVAPTGANWTRTAGRTSAKAYCRGPRCGALASPPARRS